MNAASSINIELIDYSDPANLKTKKATLDEFLADYTSQKEVWVNIEYIEGEENTNKLLEKLGVHHLLTESILDEEARPKFQEFEDYYFFSIRAIVGMEGSDFQTQTLHLLLKDHNLITLSNGIAHHVEKMIAKIESHQEILKEDAPDYLLYLIFECIVDDYFIYIEKAEEMILGIDMIQQDTKLNPLILRKIEHMKSEVHVFKKSVIPLKEFLSKLAGGKYNLIDPNNTKYFDDLKNDSLSLIDECEYLQVKMESKANMFFSVQGHRMNQIMQTLTVISAIFIPLTFIAGIYGMNFRNMPETNSKWGYLGVWIVMTLITFIMLRYFRKKKWF
ncbi:MAG: magnesium/cobalt transporter CorA [Crocinitomicaceae bacterium]